MSIQAEIARIKNAKSEIKMAIESKGISIPENTSLSNYASKILEIKASGENLVINNVKVPITAWEDDYTHENFFFKATLQLDNVTEDHFPIVALSPSDSQEGVVSSIAETFNGGIYLYSSIKPIEEILIYTIFCIKAV